MSCVLMSVSGFLAEMFDRALLELFLVYDWGRQDADSLRRCRKTFVEVRRKMVFDSMAQSRGSRKTMDA